jgi:hypothetical protein
MCSSNWERSIDLREFAHVLLNGTPETRRLAALRLVESQDRRWLTLLVDTVRSAEQWQLRARCLEALGLIAGESQQETAERIMDALLERPGRL